jgi:CRP-like cAMP-binding protein
VGPIQFRSAAHEKNERADVLADAELCSEIEKWSLTNFVKEAKTLFRQGDSPGYAFFVKAGAIALTMHVSGDPLWRVRATSGSLVGLPAIVGNEPYSKSSNFQRGTA